MPDDGCILAAMPASYLSPKAAPRRTGSGVGAVVALEAIAAGDVVGAFGGRCIDRREIRELPMSASERSVQIDDELYMIDDGAEVVSHIGHSCHPNCGLRGAVLVVAMRDIVAGEILTFDRAMTEGSDVHERECQCGAGECRGKVTGDDWMLPELQLRYRGFFSPYLARRISSLVSVGAERRAFAL